MKRINFIVSLLIYLAVSSDAKGLLSTAAKLGAAALISRAVDVSNEDNKVNNELAKHNAEFDPGQLNAAEFPWYKNWHWALFCGQFIKDAINLQDDITSASALITPTSAVITPTSAVIVIGAGLSVIASKKASSNAQEELKKIRAEFERNYLESVCLKAEQGDLIEIVRGDFAHWAIYVSEGKVIHLTGEEENGYKYLRQTLEVVAGDNKHRINNMNGSVKGLSAKSQDEILKCAFSRLNEIEYNYSVFDFNCEHFVTQCRYGKAFSLQAEVVDNALLKYFLKTIMISGAAKLAQKN